MASTAFVAGISQVANALNFPPTRSGWEKHSTSPWEVGARATLTRPHPSVVLTETDWWRARSFEYHGVYAIDNSYGAAGAGPAKYIPLGQTSPVYVELKYYWDSVAGTQGYDVGSTTPTSATTYQVYYNGLGCWLRYTSTQGWDSDVCITNFVQGHPSYQATTNSASTDSTKNSIVGIFNTVQYKSGSTWSNLSSNSGGKYCSTLGSTGTYGQVEFASPSQDQLKTGNSASTNSCSGIRDGAVYGLPG